MKVSEKMIKCVLKYAYKHRKEIATMLRDGLNAYLECIPKRRGKKQSKKITKEEIEKIAAAFGA